MDSRSAAFDYVLVGGGLQNALIALALAEHAPEASVALIEASPRLGDGHTWSFHASDVDADAERVAQALTVYRSDSHEVRFEQFSRQLAGAYCTVTGERLAAAIATCFSERPRFSLFVGRRARTVLPHCVELDDGHRLRAKLVIDARGPSQLKSEVAGYQKFLGLELEWTKPHGIERPLLMDARVPQLDGYRFVYVLPFGPRRALVEDTYFSDTPELDVEPLRERVLDYVAAQGLSPPTILREEQGVLPLPRKVEVAAGTSPLRAGYAGGFLHPTTGYSFPVALRLAMFIAKRPPDAVFGREFDAFVARHARQLRFAELLNRLLFQGLLGERRRGVFERFYRLPEATIARFYALDTTALDRTRILCGRPPRGISLKRALFGGVSA